MIDHPNPSAELLAKLLLARELGVPVRDVNSVLPKLFVELVDAMLPVNTGVSDPEFVVDGTPACKPVPLPERGQVFVYEGNLCEVLKASMDMIEARWLDGNEFGRKTLDFVRNSILTMLPGFDELKLTLKVGSEWHMPVHEKIEKVKINAVSDIISYWTSIGFLTLPKQDFLLAHERALHMLEKNIGT